MDRGVISRETGDRELRIAREMSKFNSVTPRQEIGKISTPTSTVKKFPGDTHQIRPPSMLRLIPSLRSSARFGRKFSTNSPPAYIKHAHLWNPSCSFINGQFVHQNYPDQFPVYNPANGQLIATYPKLKLADVQPCEQISFDAWKIWKNTTPKERSKILRKMADLMHLYIDDLAHIITVEAGKPLPEARGEILYAASFFEFYGEEAKRAYGEIIPPVVHGRKYLTMKQSIGPAAMITPWNFPSAMITRKVRILSPLRSKCH
jgi:delta 1-pyrroline-5-carboxylate dehydrogenase